SGRFAQAEFAADLAQVLRGDAASEYGDPEELYRRTFLTDGLRRLLLSALSRLSGKGGDPVIELQTNFGGGKTHSMLALYHLFSDTAAGKLAGVDVLLDEAGIEQVPQAKRAVLVGTALPAGQPRKKPDGCEIRTFWGELAWQLLGKEGFEFVAESDANGVNPGSDALTELFRKAGPCLILIDEWIAYLRQMFEVPGLPGGSFDANLSFAQSVTEAARAVPQTLLVASLPQSNIEIGGDGGKQALALLENTFGRMESNWRPASQAESYEIVRRRLFESIDPDLYPSRDIVIRAYMDLYNKQESEFPSGCKEKKYQEQLESSYPIHPELFERLYSDWASLEEFQRTRGVLRLMAAVIYSLWSRDDRSLMIMPSSVPIDDPACQEELTRYLQANWVPVIEKDVDGLYSLPLRLDGENPNLGRYSACRRVARTIYMGSAPLTDATRKGIDDRHVKLGCVQPGETVPIFGDAIRRLTDQATHLYVDGSRYWFSTHPSVTRLAQDRAAQQLEDDVYEEIRNRLKAEQRFAGDFAKVHPCPSSSGDVPDETDARLVILSPNVPHVANAEKSPALQLAGDILENRGSGPRLNRNTLVFLAPDKARLVDLEQAVRQYLAWKSIHEERDALNLDNFQKGQAKTKLDQSNDAVAARIPETYQWLLVPDQTDPQKPFGWQAIRQQGQERLAVRASKKLVNDALLVTKYAGTLLRMDLDKIPLWRGDHITVRQLCEDMAQYLYLPRFKDESVILGAIRDGVSSMTWREDSFAWADSFDEDRNRYLGLKSGINISVSSGSQGLLVRPEVAARQIEADAVQTQQSVARTTTQGDPGVTPDEQGQASGSGPAAVETSAVVETKPRRFYGSVQLDATRVGRDAGRIAQEVLSHLTGLPGAKAEVVLEIQVEIPDGASEQVVRTVTENCRTLKFTSQGFEES
ncbi:MAG: ATP-binding protein, partial [Maioricimonas sp. JB049]